MTSFIIKKDEEILDAVAERLVNDFDKGVKGNSICIEMSRLAYATAIAVILPTGFREGIEKINPPELPYAVASAIQLILYSRIGLIDYEWYDDWDACNEIARRIRERGMYAECRKKGLLFKKIVIYISR